MDFKSILLGVIVGGLAGVFVAKRLLEEELQEAIDEERKYLGDYYASRAKLMEEGYKQQIDEYRGVEDTEDESLVDSVINETQLETDNGEEYDEEDTESEYVDDIIRFIDADEYYKNEVGATVIFYYRKDCIYTTYEKTKMTFPDVEDLVGSQAMETIEGTVRTVYLHNTELDQYILLEGLDKSFVDSVLKRQG